MHGNIINKNKVKLFNTANSDLAARILILENNVYKITYYEIISGATGTLTVPTAATINANEFSGANCILSEIDVNNKPTWVSPKNAGGTVVTASLNTGTGAWVKSGVTVSANVALIYSLNIRAADYANLTNFYIVEETVIGDFSYVLNNTTIGTVTSALLANAMSDETGSGSLVFGTSPTFTTDITTPLIIGGSIGTSKVTIKSTTGTSDNTDGINAFEVLSGINGNRTVASFQNNGNVIIGGSSNTNTVWLKLESAGGGINQFITFQRNGSNGWGVGRKSDASFSISYVSSGIPTLGTNEFLNISNTGVFSLTGNVSTSGAITNYSLTIPANTGQTASTEIPNFKVTGNTKTWANGGGATTIATQRWNHFTANTAATSGGGSLTITNSYGAYFEKAVASGVTITNNYAAGFDGDINVNGSINNSAGSIALKAFGFTTYTSVGSNITLATAGATSGSTNAFTFTAASNTGQTASTEINGYLYNSYTRTWATGAITTQREQYIKTVTYAFAAASTITNAYGLYVETPTAGSNATITNPFSIGTSGHISIGGAIMFSNSTAIDVSGSALRLGASGAYTTVSVLKDLTVSALNIITDTTTGMKIGTGTTQKIGFWNATPIVQPTTAVAAATFAANTSGIANDTATFDGYTIGQVVKALRNTGLLA